MVNEVRNAFNFESGMEGSSVGVGGWLSVSVAGAPVGAVWDWGKKVNGPDGIGIEGNVAIIA